ncbi:MAG: hypothetical protein JO129_03385 [Candidatus Dependentiae bacterium]|nr:hypothetical protein [Candidatus Dependentiae bacterium]
MKLKRLLSLIFLSSFMLLRADNFQNQIIIPSVDIENPFWEFAGQPITQAEDNCFANLIEKWNAILDQLWMKLNNKIRQDINISIHQINYYLEGDLFINVYDDYCRRSYPEIEDAQDADFIVLNFANFKLYYLQLQKPLFIIVKNNNNSLFSEAVGTDKKGHYLILNANVYNSEEITSLYNPSENKSKFRIERNPNTYKSQIIEPANFLHFGIAQAISSVIHQSDYFSKILRVFTYNKKPLSQETQEFAADYVLFQSYLEATLQSKNPLEIARYLEPKVDCLHYEFAFLWRDFIQDIENCYDPEDLQAYEDLISFERRAILFSSQDDE